jgi:hypothetical protein
MCTDMLLISVLMSYQSMMSFTTLVSGSYLRPLDLMLVM